MDGIPLFIRDASCPAEHVILACQPDDEGQIRESKPSGVVRYPVRVAARSIKGEKEVDPDQQQNDRRMRQVPKVDEFQELRARLSADARQGNLISFTSSLRVLYFRHTAQQASIACLELRF